MQVAPLKVAIARSIIQIQACNRVLDPIRILVQYLVGDICETAHRSKCILFGANVSTVTRVTGRDVERNIAKFTDYIVKPRFSFSHERYGGKFGDRVVM